MDRKTVIALILSALVLLTYQMFMSKYYPAEEATAPEHAAIEKGTEESLQTLEAVDLTAARVAEEEGRAKPRRPREEVAVETEKFVVTLSNEGGCIKSIVLKEYPHPTTREVFQLVDVTDPSEGIFNIASIGGGAHIPIRYALTRGASRVGFSTTLDSGLEIEKRFTFHEDAYHIDFELYIHNKTAESILTDYSIVTASHIDIPSKLDRRYTQIVSSLNGEPRRDNGKKGEGLFVSGTVNYAGLQNKYFSVIAKTSAATAGLFLREIEENNLLSEVKLEKFIINPGTTTSHSYVLYAGPTKSKEMEVYGMSSAVSYGFFGGISKVLLSGLTLFQRVFRNWGVAIILLASCVNLILFPLSKKSYTSMKKVQQLQPHMERLRSEHKDNPQKLNKEMMDLYKKYNVNPMGGCLPLLLQMPMFIALYQALMRSLSLRGARFLWIRDLSMPDAVPLPFTLPLIGKAINILPILMAGAMVVQQQISMKKTGGGSDQLKQQQQMMMMMPILFLFIMYNFPSGLVLYWLTNTVLTMVEQRAIMRA